MIEVDIYNAGKTQKQGLGPIWQITDFRASDRPNQAGRWSFTMPAEAQSNVVQLGREAYGYVWERGSRICIFGGEITDLSPVENGDGGIDLEVSGFGVLDRFNRVWLDDLEIKDSVSTRPVQVFDLFAGTDLPNTYDNNTGTNSTFTLGAVSTRSYYICYTQPFWNVSMTFSSVNASTTSAMSIQYYAYDTGSGSPGWASLSFTDGTAVSGRTCAQNGVLSFTAPTDWKEGITGVGNAVQGYWIRLYVDNLITVGVSEIAFTSYGVDTDDFNTVVNAASASGVTIQSGGGYYSSTTNGSYFRVQNATALTAFRKVAETENGVFRVEGRDQYKIAYLRDQGYTTNIQAVGPAAPQDFQDVPSNQVLITGIDPQTSTDDEVNRVYIRGAGNGRAAQVDIELADTSILPAGYDADTAASYVQKTTVTTRKSAGAIFPQIRNLDGARSNREAATQLLRMGLAELQSRVDPVEYVRIELVHLPRAFLPGDKIRISYRRWGGIGNQLIINIDGTYQIMEVSYRVVGGVLVCEATCSNVTRLPRDEFDYVLALAERNKMQIETPQGTRAADVFGDPVTRTG